ncbi:hypothetical protein BC628DRAFT_1073087 [Trametes gibbosa]|nr:hypothetical protein BC628DRAFT_1073087 [Trametes gibbosa]
MASCMRISWKHSFRTQQGPELLNCGSNPIIQRGQPPEPFHNLAKFHMFIPQLSLRAYMIAMRERPDASKTDRHRTPLRRRGVGVLDPNPGWEAFGAIQYSLALQS